MISGWFERGGIIALVALFYLPANVYAAGNFPQSKQCSSDQPYHSLCTHSLHNLEGWYGPCRKTRAEAQKDADQHSQKYHKGNSRWTGVRKAFDD